MLILVINCGSSSVKYDLFDIDGASSDLCRGVVERIGEDSATLTHEVTGAKKTHRKIVCRNHHQAVEIIRDALLDEDKSVISDASEVKGVGHRVVHGGDDFSESILINDDVLRSIEKFSPLAPLHNPLSLEGIKSCMEIFPAAKEVAVFDTAFHHSMEKHVFCYGIEYKFYEKYGIRRYGFHGTSHRYVAERAAEILNKPLERLNAITVHLGNGCSAAAISGGKSVDTSMGFTPLEGLVMGTRSGDIDPAVVTFLMQREGLDEEGVNSLLNKKSGLLGISGVSNDMRDIFKAIDSGNERARLAYDIFLYRIKKYIGAYAAVLGRVDAVVFTAGIGENAPQIKNSIEKDLRELLGKSTKFIIIVTNEELLIAKDTYGIVSRLAG